MGRTAKSQWEFGELFSEEATRRVLSVSDLTGQVKRLLEQQIGLIWVTGEITNFRLQSSGHAYFTLKDSRSQLNCVLFRGEKVAHRDLLEDGQKVILQGDLTVYEPRGQYQLVVREVELQGVGALQLAFEKLKKKLHAEGLFAAERKRPLPRYPRRIGLVTSPTGAAIRDILHVARRRNPGLEWVLVPCRVQGTGAAEEIAAAIRLLNQWAAGPGERGVEAGRSRLDLILVTRGGGSLEDLWAFNEETVARAIFESGLPVLSAVGHEIDFTISDFVADARAATPSAAAEIVTEGVFASRQFIAEITGWMRQRVRQRLGRENDSLERLTQRLNRAHPRRRFNEKLQRLDDLQTSLLRSTRYQWREYQITWENLRQRLVRVRPAQRLIRRGETLELARRRLRELTRQHLKMRGQRLETLEARLRLLSPEQVLARGYSITMDAATGKVIRQPGEVSSGQRLKSRVQAGEISSTVDPTDGR